MLEKIEVTTMLPQPSKSTISKVNERIMPCFEWKIVFCESMGGTEQKRDVEFALEQPAVKSRVASVGWSELLNPGPHRTCRMTGIPAWRPYCIRTTTPATAIAGSDDKRRQVLG